MGAISIPRSGENFLGDRPSPIRVEEVLISVDSSDNPDVQVASSDGATGTYDLFMLPKNAVITEAYINKEVAFTASVTFTIGLATDVDSFFTATGIDATTTGFEKASAESAALAAGIVLDSDNITFATDDDYAHSTECVKVKLAHTATAALAGRMRVFLAYYMSAK